MKSEVLSASSIDSTGGWETRVLMSAFPRYLPKVDQHLQAEGVLLMSNGRSEVLLMSACPRYLLKADQHWTM